ncbi:MAG: bifunctional folylpolyglutamate synthase/dihydrofolate synthase [Eggerthellaceae bacterium]|nr:bifunctional folylpolyglutamate synthase/dihydrofolate synthase [Eggerthellaceae bacterium]
MDFDPVAYINLPRGMETRLGLGRIAEVLEKAGKPQDSLRFVHVAGTNGKGSTCAFIASILQEAGFVTGFFSSPYNLEFADRIRVNGKNIPHEELLPITLQVKAIADCMEDHPTEFELMCAVAFIHFVRQGCDIVVCEVGLGGRLDATNVIGCPDLCVITPIGLDHMALLGNTIAEISGEKAAIIKEGASVLSWPQLPEAMEPIERQAAAMGATLNFPDFSRLRMRAKGEGGPASLDACREFDYKGLEGLQIRLLGSYQPFNAAMAIEAIFLLQQQGWPIGETAIRRGREKASWPGRFELFSLQPTFIIDGAHNVDGVRVLIESLELNFPGARAVFVVGVLEDKDYRGMLELVVPLARAFVTITPPSPRALSASVLTKAILALEQAAGLCEEDVPVFCAQDYPEALEHARLVAGDDGVVCAFGSLYSVAAIKKAW